MADALPFETAVRVAVGEAVEIIRDGAADDLTEADYAASLRVLDGSRTASDVEALAAVVALGVEYLAGVGREADVVATIGQEPESAIRYWYLTARR